MTTLLFWIFGLAAIATAILAVTFRDILRAVMSLLLCLLNVAILFVLLDATFVATAQVLLYAGAIVALFLMATMLMGGTAPKPSKIPFVTMLVVILGALLFVELTYAITRPTQETAAEELQDYPDDAPPATASAPAKKPTPAKSAEEKSAPPERLGKNAVRQFGSLASVGHEIVMKYALPFEFSAILILEAVIGVVLFTRRKKHNTDENKEKA
jgi:NADH-quinone oxidoreductase subunit J